ncbi:MAG: PhoU domain-containing protein [Thermoplasmata archaeon]
MESRKIQKVGVSTLTISLPKEWTESQDLQKGDQVFLEREGESLRLLAPEGAQRKLDRPTPEYVIDADVLDEPRMLERVIVGNYVLGRERLIVRSSSRLSSAHLEELRDVVRRLMGLGILEETGQRAVLQCSIEPSKFPLDSLIKRLYNLGKTILLDSMEALVTRDRTLAEDALRREDDADMIYWLLVRLILSAQQEDALITKLGMENRLNNAGYRLIAKELETVADCGNAVGEAVLRLLDADAQIPSRVLASLADHASEAARLYGDGLAALITRDLKLANRTVEGGREMETRLGEFMTRVFGEVREVGTLVGLKTIVDNLSRIAEYSHSIANVAINRYLERSTPMCHAIVAEEV